jgi:hypothetical protein
VLLEGRGSPGSERPLRSSPQSHTGRFTKYGQTVHEALDEGFFGELDDDGYAMLQDLPDDLYAGIMINAMEWILAEGFITIKNRELSDPKGMLANLQPNETKERPEPTSLPPEIITELIEKRIRQLYVNWADKPLPILNDQTPREAIKTLEGLEQVKFLLHTYEHGEARQARDQQRVPVSYDFLWHSVGMTP